MSEKRLERITEKIGGMYQPNISFSFNTLYPDLSQHLGQKCVLTGRNASGYVPIGSLSEKSDFWGSDPSKEKVNQFRQEIGEYKEQFKQMLIELKQIYDSGLRFSTPDEQQLTDFMSFVFVLTKQPILRAQGEGVVNNFRVVAGSDGIDSDFRTFHEYIVSYHNRVQIVATNCKYYRRQNLDICDHSDRVHEWKEDIGPSSDDFRIHTERGMCDGVECGKYENKWGNLKSLDIIISELETPLKEE